MFVLIFDIFLLVLIALLIVSAWVVFKKAGKPGWAAIVPFYNGWVYCRLGGMPGWIYLIPFVNVIALIVADFEIAKRFGKTDGFGFLLIFLPFVALPILAFGKAGYSAPDDRRSSHNAWMVAARHPITVLVTGALVMAGMSVAAFTAGVGVGQFADLRFPWETAVSLNNDLPATPDYTTVNQVYKSLIDNYDGKLTETQLENGLKHGLAEATNDPYTVYFTPQEAKAFNDELNNSFSGIGAQLGQDQDKNLEIIAPIAGLPAEKAGLKAGDLITKINGVSTSGMSVDDAVNRIRGKKGTKVTLEIVRNHSQTMDFTITRDDIKLPSVKTKILAGNIGYMQISDFSDDTAALAQKAADDFKSKHVKGIVVDLRDDPGGLLDAAIHVSSLWLPQGTEVLQEKRGQMVVNNYSALPGGGELSGIPTVVLINGGSASASEITAGALHDNKAAYIIGEKSYGKGVVQNLINFGDGSQLKVTVASWYRPDGQNINHKGITPDKTIKLTDAEAQSGNDVQLNAAESYLNK